MSFDIGAIRQIGKYPVERFIAEGGMAWVFRVKDPDLFDAPRALKLLKPEAATGDDYQRFLAEAQILATIQHPNLIHVYDFGQDTATGCHFYTMDYIEGRTLSQIPPEWLAEEEEEDDDGTVPDAVPEEADVDPNATSFIYVRKTPVKTRHTVRDICRYFSDVLAALARLHRENVIHRDIKPDNIFLTHDGIAILGDLGIAKGRLSSAITETSRVPGTPLYMSPEHAMGDPATVRSDIFSLGLSLYAVLSGETVYDQIDEVAASDSQAVLRYLIALTAEEEEFEFVFHESIPDEVCDVIERACRIKESDRYASADDFNEALRNAIGGVSRPGEGGMRPAVAAAAGIAVLALAGYFGLQAYLGSDKAVAAEEAAARTRALGDDTAALIERLAALEEPPTSELLELASAEVAAASSNAATGRTELDEEDYDDAQRMFVRARSGYDKACDGLVSGFLEGAAPLRVKGARNVREQVEPAAEQIVPHDWKELEGLTAEFDSELAAAGCERAQGLWGRIETAARVVSKSHDVGAEMSRRLPEVSTAALASAEEARGGARAFQTDRSEYQALMDVAAADLESARRAMESGDHSAAIRGAKRARRDFDRAAGVRPATEARESSRKLMSEIEAQGLRLGALRVQEQAANRTWSDGEYGKAAEAYLALLEQTDALYRSASASMAARNDAQAAREDAEGWAVPARLLSEGESLYSQATVELRAGRFDAAEQLFHDSLAGFQDAKRQAAEEGLIDPKASNAEALQLAQSRAEQAERERRVEDERRTAERRQAEARELAAQEELDALRAALEAAKKAPAPQRVAAVVAPGEDLGLHEAMKRYEIAYESRSIDDLNRVWSMSRFERLQVQRLFDDCQQIRVQVSFADSKIKGSTARVDYDETIVFKDCETTRSGSRYSELSASLARRGDEWQIKTIRPR